MDTALTTKFFESIFYSPDGCWYWIGPNKKKYGYLTVAGKKDIRATRLSYILHKGEFDSSLLVCHSCDNPLCVNPDHLWLGTALDNSSDMIAKGRRPLILSNVKLTENDVLEIRLSKARTIDLSKRYSVSRRTITNIKSKSTWRHL